MKKILSLLSATVMMFSITACTKTPEPILKAPSTTTETTTTPETTPAPIVKPKLAINPLTGEETLPLEAEGKRPVAVMVNNSIDNLPQYGLSEADVIFEVTVEGNMTRLMAMYPDFMNIPDICSIRSARYYYPIIAEGFDAIYVHWGKNEQFATPELKELGTDAIDGMYGPLSLFNRDQDRIDSGYALEHTSVLYGDELPKQIANRMFRTNIEEDKQGAFFNFNSEPVAASGDEMLEFNFDYGTYDSGFVYNSKTKTYQKYHTGREHMVGKPDSQEQLSFTNVIMLITPDNNMPGGTSGVKEIDVVTDGKTGYYISNGKYEKITWVKTTKQSEFKFFKEDGTELSINTGKTYIGIGNPKITWGTK